MTTGRIYKIYIPGLEEFCYVGSTIKTLAERLAIHKHNSKKPSNGYHFASHVLFEEGNEPVIELLEELEFENRQELLERERYHQDMYPDCVNKNPSILSDTERHERQKATQLACYHKNKEHRLESHKAWIEANKEQQAAYKKAKREENLELARQKDKEARERRKEKIAAAKKERVSCPDCGKEMNKNSLWEHKKKVHKPS